MKKFLLTLLVLIGIQTALVPAIVGAAATPPPPTNPTKDAVCSGIGAATGGTGCADPPCSTTAKGQTEGKQVPGKRVHRVAQSVTPDRIKQGE